jgi:hypothetical protein
VAEGETDLGRQCLRMKASDNAHVDATRSVRSVAGGYFRKVDPPIIEYFGYRASPFLDYGDFLVLESGIDANDNDFVIPYVFYWTGTGLDMKVWTENPDAPLRPRWGGATVLTPRFPSEYAKVAAWSNGSWVFFDWDGWEP